MARRFADLAAEEFDAGRLVHYRSDVQGVVARVRRALLPETARRVDAVLADRFLAGAVEDDEVEVEES